MALLRFAGLISLCLLLLWQPVLVVESSSAQELREESALETSTRLQQQIALFDEQIIALESEFGPFHQALLEPLQGLTDLHIEAGDFEEVSGLLNRRLQLLHTLEGPSTLNQITVLTELISNDIRLQRWGSVTDRFELIHLLHTQNPEVDATTRLASLEELRTWHQAAVYADEPRRRVTHFLESREIQKDIISRAEREFGENGVELIPWLYGYAVDQHRIKAFLSSTDELGHAARRDIARREARGQISYLREGFNVVERIQEIVETLDNPEAEAMAKLYVADFQLLMREYSNSSFGGRVATRSRGNSASTYRDAMEMLQEAGIDQAKIDAFFQRPVVLPISEYYLSLDAAMAQQTTTGYAVNTKEQEGENRVITVHMGDFIAWNESLPFAHRPAMPELIEPLNEELISVSLQFTIDSVGKSRTPRAQEAVPDTVRARRDAQDAIRDMQFRPSYVNGRWREIRDVTMRYRYPPPQ